MYFFCNKSLIMRIDNDSEFEVESYDFDKTMEEINQLCNEISEMEKTNIKYNINAIDGDEPIIYPESYLINKDRRIVLYDNNYTNYKTYLVFLYLFINIVSYQYIMAFKNYQNYILDSSII